ncbi:SpoVT / AbrB like domain protein [Caulifigura coniformis]|uniref:SpoVT / AbrB like domain protein n=1 Tax=Caulifigura coniformis TaxID=2527983 RepID=A0A517SA77_9PLAN|nr:AbrB/MazE/SpoVT family DNA-binding domain-containing protein [Caulifigura coniformis]QDT53022.1 SpoVT / AbrB like domain protein [Caulifigura coniformis]
MDDIGTIPSHVYRTKLDRSGRIVLPQRVRDKLHLSSGDEVLVVPSGDSYRIETPEQSLKAAQDYFKSLVPAGVSLVDELLADRHAEAARERTESEGAPTGETSPRG